MPSPTPWSIQTLPTATGETRTEITDAEGEGVIAIRRPTERATENAERIVAAVNATSDLTPAQLEADLPRRAIAALSALMKKYDSASNAIPVPAKLLAQVQKLLDEL